MSRPLDEIRDESFNSVIGLGSSSIRKSYYPGLKRFRALLDQSSEGIILATHPEGGIIDMNDTAREYSKSLIETEIKTIFELFKDKPELIQALKNDYTSYSISYHPKKLSKDLYLDISCRKVNFENRDYTVLIMHDVTEKEQLLMALKQSLDEKNVLLKEVHHRVKNNLQLVNSLINLQDQSQNHNEEMEQFINDLRTRILSMALVHEQLYISDDMNRINMPEYIHSLTESIRSTIPGSASNVEMFLDVDDIGVSVDNAIPLGLMLNEMITNSFKHAFPDRKKGRIEIHLKNNGNELEITFQNNGIPFPADFSMESSGTLGTALISSLVLQLNAEMEFSGTDGAFYSIKKIKS